MKDNALAFISNEEDWVVFSFSGLFSSEDFECVNAAAEDWRNGDCDWSNSALLKLTISCVEENGVTTASVTSVEPAAHLPT